jgi:hypothetical protein
MQEAISKIITFGFDIIGLKAIQALCLIETSVIQMLRRIELIKFKTTKMKVSKTILFHITILLVFNSCDKSDTCPAGQAGQNGTNGSVNINSKIFTVDPGEWNSTSSFVWNVTFSDTAIADADKVVVMAYISDSSGIWWAIPTGSFLAGNDQFDLFYNTGNVTIRYMYTTAPSVTLYVKIVVIPSTMKKAKPNVNIINY